MYYSSFSMLALLLHLIIHYDMFRKPKALQLSPAALLYRRFILSITFYYITDIIWGFLNERRLITLVFADTTLYFIFLAVSVFLWCRYTIEYLNRNNAFSKFLGLAGWVILAFVAVSLLLNFFVPVFFVFGAEEGYTPLTARTVTMVLLTMLYLSSSVYSLLAAFRSRGNDRWRHLVVGSSGLIMTVFILLQWADAFLPFYAIGSLTATCLVHSTIAVEEKKAQQRELDLAVQREKILMASRYDHLTGLPNLSYFFELAESGKEAMLRRGESPVLLYMDLYGMKSYNIRQGFEEGNRLLKAFAGVLADRFGKEQCAHIGADRFAAFTREEDLEGQLDRLFEDARKMNGGSTLPVHTGIFQNSMEDVPAATAYDQAKMACDEIRKTAVSCFNYFSEDLQNRVMRRSYIRRNLDRAIRENWIRVYYQPIVRAVNGRVCGEEALARWIDPVEGFLSPAEFIPDLEDSGLIHKLDLCVVDLVLDKIRKQAEAGLNIVPHSINLSRSDFDACNMVEEIRKRVDGAGISRDKIVIEITESVIGSSFGFIKDQVSQFRSLGFPVWMDDFGSGYSSLDVLQDIRFDMIKFDMSFTRKLEESESARIILSELMRMASALDIDTICEGVETAAQVRFLEEIGCSKLQGFYYCKPIPFEAILERYRANTQIGFENPEETAYYDSIGRVSLYDLAVISTGEEDNSLRNAFTMLPMGMIEIQGDLFRFVRSNSSYREFFRRLLGLDSPPDLPQHFIPYHSRTMHHIVKHCCEQGTRSFFDETLPDGSTAHSFARRISTNPVTGSMAVVIAVLSVTEPA